MRFQQYWIWSSLIGGLVSPVLASELTQLDEVTVTGTREASAVVKTPAAIKVIKGEQIRADQPAHPSQLLGQAPGVWVNTTGGEGHMTAIRHPLTTNPVYLYLEDGIPTRSTGFFNHNALYEINLPQAGGVEVTRGPGTALYGSDAIGGVINVLTRPAAQKPHNALSVELGDHGWKRVLGSVGKAGEDDAIRADLNLTAMTGWRDSTAYVRESATLRWDQVIGDHALLKTVLTGSHIDQDTAGTSGLIRTDYEQNPKKNYTPISYRKVSAFRLSTSYEQEADGRLISLTPFLRDNSMALLPNWALSFDPTVYTTGHQSYGLLFKWRQDLAPLQTRLIAGVDLDVSPGGRDEKRLATLSTSGSGASKMYNAYTEGTRIYDYDVTFIGVSPYVHGEFSPTPKTRMSLGLRYDNLRYRFDNHFSGAVSASTSENGGAAVTRWYGQTEDNTVRFTHLSPKLGMTYQIDPVTHVYASYNHSFRAPSEGQLFRPSAQTDATRAQLAAASALSLKPVVANQYEVGVKGKAKGLDYGLSVYRLQKRNDILSYRDPISNATQVVNAGQTLHRGVEWDLGAALNTHWRLDWAYSYAKHTYASWFINGTTPVDYSGKEMETAPRHISNMRLTWSPQAQTRVVMQWEKLGSYWMDQANTSRYAGHDLIHLGFDQTLSKDWKVFAKVRNVLDARYAENASVSSGVDTFAPGLPRTIYLGVRRGFD